MGTHGPKHFSKRNTQYRQIIQIPTKIFNFLSQSTLWSLKKVFTTQSYKDREAEREKENISLQSSFHNHRVSFLGF